MRHGIREVNRVSEVQHFSLHVQDLEPGQLIVLVDIDSKSPVISIMCQFDWSANDRIAVMVAGDLINYLYTGEPFCLYYDGQFESMIFDLRRVWIHSCTGC